jgi:hypothetical protein
MPAVNRDRRRCDRPNLLIDCARAAPSSPRRGVAAGPTNLKSSIEVRRTHQSISLCMQIPSVRINQTESMAEDKALPVIGGGPVEPAGKNPQHRIARGSLRSRQTGIFESKPMGVSRTLPATPLWLSPRRRVHQQTGRLPEVDLTAWHGAADLVVNRRLLSPPSHRTGYRA